MGNVKIHTEMGSSMNRGVFMQLKVLNPKKKKKKVQVCNCNTQQNLDTPGFFSSLLKEKVHLNFFTNTWPST